MLLQSILNKSDQHEVSFASEVVKLQSLMYESHCIIVFFVY